MRRFDSRSCRGCARLVRDHPRHSITARLESIRYGNHRVFCLRHVPGRAHDGATIHSLHRQHGTMVLWIVCNGADNGAIGAGRQPMVESVGWSLLVSGVLLMFTA